MGTVHTGVGIDELLAGPGRHPALADVDVLATGVGQGPKATRAAERSARAYGVDLAAMFAAESFRGRVGEVVRVPVQPPTGPPADPALPARWLLVGTGAGTPTDLRRGAAALARVVRGRRHLAADLIGSGRGRPAAQAVRAVVEGLLLGGHAAPTQRTAAAADRAAVGQVLLLGDLPADALARGELHARTGAWARDLAVTPSSVKSPAWMVEQARAVAERSGLTIEIWDAARLQEESFGGLLAVGGGSATPPYLVRLDHHPDGPGRPADRRGRRPVVLVGKGITFDTGGISLKPRPAMVGMKSDMAGAGAVLAVLTACREAGVRVPVTGLLPLAENAIGATAYRPSDVVRHYGGRTVEVTNTDAEGRMVLADALAYADDRLDPAVLVDVATLTGAATQGLGRRHAALFSPDDALARSLTAAGLASGERLWRMPLVEEYRAWLDSDIADLRQVTSHPAGGGGAVLAALFLQSFAGGRPWAHLDIAGPARSEREEHEVPKGPTGFGARVLLRWLEGLGRRSGPPGAGQ